MASYLSIFRLSYLLLLLPCCLLVPIFAEVVEEKRLAMASTSESSNVLSTTSEKPIHKRLDFLQAFFGTISVIVVSEIGDKTFFIAAIMAMKHPRFLVFIGAISALALMTILSVMFGWAVTVIPKPITYYLSTLLFLIFGIKMIRDGCKMSPNESQEEYEEVQADLRKKEEQHLKKIKSTKPKKKAVSPEKEPDHAAIQVLPVATENVENVENSINDKKEEEEIKSEIAQFEKETLTKDVEAGYVDKNSKVAIFKVLSHIVMQAFTLTFIAEWGDRSQITTIVMAARDNVVGIALGGITGHAICTGVAVIGGRFIAQKISVKTVTIVGGFVFIFFAIITLFLQSSVDEKLAL